MGQGFRSSGTKRLVRGAAWDTMQLCCLDTALLALELVALLWGLASCAHQWRLCTQTCLGSWQTRLVQVGPDRDNLITAIPASKAGDQKSESNLGLADGLTNGFSQHVPKRF